VTDADPYALLETCLGDLVRVGALPEERRRDAPLAAWSAVHGLALLPAEGRLSRLDAARRARVTDRTARQVRR
jgi:hypothetical protein